MAQVSIGQVENLAEAVAALSSCLEQAQSECVERIARVEQKLEETGAALAEAEQALEAARETGQAAIAAVERAETQLQAAENTAASAQAALSSCEAGGYYDDDGNFIEPNCSFEESSLEQAETDETNAREALQFAQERREDAARQRIRAERKAELVRQNYQQISQLADQVKNECNLRLRTIEALVSEGQARLYSAQAALDSYLAANPEAKAFYDWLKWQPPANKPVNPADIHNRLNLSAAQQRMFLQYLTERDPEFRKKIAEYRRQLDEAKGDAEKAAVLAQVRSNLSGAYAEKFVASALGALGTGVKVHVKHDLKSGSYTFTDIVITGLKVPVILGRGKGMAAPKGGSIAIEIKNGKSDYLKHQKDHMVKQSGGHRDADASMTICTRDIKDLTPEEEEALRKALREAGSPLVGMLPRKDETDKILWDAIKGGGGAG